MLITHMSLLSQRILSRRMWTNTCPRTPRTLEFLVERLPSLCAMSTKVATTIWLCSTSLGFPKMAINIPLVRHPQSSTPVLQLPLSTVRHPELRLIFHFLFFFFFLFVGRNYDNYAYKFEPKPPFAIKAVSKRLVLVTDAKTHGQERIANTSIALVTGIALEKGSLEIAPKGQLKSKSESRYRYFYCCSLLVTVVATVLM